MNIVTLVKTAWERTRGGITTNIYIVMFTAFFLVGLFLGDGKQPIIDVFAASSIVVLYVIAFWQKSRFRALPRLVSLLWWLLILYYIARTPFSDDAGYSISATTRLVMAYLVYYLFSSIASEKTLRSFADCLILVAGAATAASFMFIAFPPLAQNPPFMNLLYASYQHNHLADLLVPVFPIVLARAKARPGLFPVGLLVFFTIGLVLTFARGAWILIALYFIYQFVTGIRGGHAKGLRIAVVAGALFTGLFLGISLLARGADNQKTSTASPWLERQIFKTSLTGDRRWIYWRQAALAVQERPWFGSGPGTFYLQSKRLQQLPYSYSWFAHNLPLQSVVELGTVGSLLLFSLFLVCTLQVTRRASQQWGAVETAEKRPLLWGAALTLLYSFYEFNLDFILIWLVTWATLGILAPANGQSSKWASETLARAGLFMVASFYVVSALGWAFFSSSKTKMVSAALLSFNAEAIRRVENPASSLLVFFHRRNPEVIYFLARNKETLGDYAAAQNYYRLLTKIDPKNWEYHQKYIALATKGGTKNDSMSALQGFTQSATSEKYHHELYAINFSDDSVVGALDARINIVFDGTADPVFALQKLYYYAGLDMLPVDPGKTRQFWTLARDIFPNWGYYHMELAALEYYYFHNPEAARVVLQYCQNFIYTAQWCATTPPEKLPQVGSLEANIRAIPIILN